jgi:hypothetical protein
MTNGSLYHTVREWAVRLPERDSAEWNELVALLFNRRDIADDWWSTEMVVTALVSWAQEEGHGQFPGYQYLAEDGSGLHTRVLATVQQVPASRETVYSPQHWKWSLEPTETEVEKNPELSVVRMLNELQEIDDPEQREAALRNIVSDLTEHLNDTYGS